MIDTLSATHVMLYRNGCTSGVENLTHTAPEFRSVSNALITLWSFQCYAVTQFEALVQERYDPIFSNADALQP